MYEPKLKRSKWFNHRSWKKNSNGTKKSKKDVKLVTLKSSTEPKIEKDITPCYNEF